MISKITLTGGPRAGKSTVLQYLKEKLPIYNIVPVFVPELATMVFSNGIDYSRIGAFDDTNIAFQIEMNCFQMRMEAFYGSLLEIQYIPEKKHRVLICDRGAVDNLAYVKDQWALDHIITRTNWHFNDPDYLRTFYRNVIFLETSAMGNEYIQEDNAIRRENQDEALEMDRRTLSMWNRYTDAEIHFIPYHPNFEIKCKNVLNAIKNKVI